MDNNFIDKSVNIGTETTIGINCIISRHVKIGKGSVLGNNIVIHAGTIIGNNVRIDDNAVVGKEPMKAANSATTSIEELVPGVIGNDCIIGTGAIIYRGSQIGNKVLIADLATIRENVTIGDFTIVGRGVAIENFCEIGRYCKLETNVYITAHSRLDDRVFIAPCVATSNDNFVGRTEKRFKFFKGIMAEKGARIGVNATILPGKTIGADALVAAGALITKDVPPRRIYAGVPAKDFGPVPEEELLKNQNWPG
ncbi:MAG: acyltransferase [Candidatus Zixiibacteriota bacterium]